MNLKIVAKRWMVLACLAGLVFLTLTGTGNGTEIVSDKAKEAEEKIYQAKLRFKSYLNLCVDGFAKNGITVAGLADDIAKFRGLYDEAKKKYKEGKNDLAYETINKAETFYISFYPHIKAGQAVVDLKEKLDALREVCRLYESKGKNVSYVALPALDRRYERLAQSLQQGKFNVRGEVEKMEGIIRQSYARLDKESPYNLPVRLGLSQTSFGRFGWCPANADVGEGLLINNLKKEPFSMLKEYGPFYFIFKPSWMKTNAAPENVIDKKTDVTWVFYKRQYTCKNPEGGETRWNLLCSLLAPGIILQTDEKCINLQGKIRQVYGPNKLLLPTEAGCRVINLPMGEEYRLAEMKENWLLLLWDGEGREKFDGVLLVFEKKPESIHLAEDGKYAKLKNVRGMGHIGMLNYSGVMPFDAGQIQTWEKAVPETVVNRCRDLSRLMMTYPVECKEFYMVNKQDRRISIRNEIGYYRIKDEWGSAGKEFSPLPPILSFVGERGYPFKVNQELQDFDIATKYGPYKAAAGQVLEYEIPIPDFNHRCYLNTDNWFGLRESIRNVFPAILTKEGKFLSLTTETIYPSCMFMYNLLDNKLQETILKKQKESLDTARQNKTQPETLQSRIGVKLLAKDYMERVEPFTGKYYRFCGAGSSFQYKQQLEDNFDSSLGYDDGWDVLNAHSLLLEYFYYYAKYSGDWDFIRQNWDYLKEVHVILTRINDWANMAISYHEHCADTHTDMGPDCLKQIAFISLSEVMGDEESLLLANYIAAKKAIPVLSQYAMGEYFRKYSNEPDAKYCFWENGLSEWGLPADFQGTYYFDLWDPKSRGGRGGWGWIVNTYDGVNGCIEILDLRDQYMSAYLKKFIFETYPSRCGDWYNFTSGCGGLFPDDIIAKNRTEYVRILFGEPVPKSVEYLDKAFTLSSSSYSLWYLGAAFNVLQGRDAPAYLIAWEPNKLAQGAYDWSSNIATIDISARTSGVVKLKSFMPPLKVEDNVSGSKIKAGNEYWQYNDQRKILAVFIEPGEHRLALDYTGWKTNGTHNPLSPAWRDDAQKKHDVKINYLDEIAWKQSKTVSPTNRADVYVPDGDFEGEVDMARFGEKGPCNRFDHQIGWSGDPDVKAGKAHDVVHSGKRSLHLVGVMHPRPGQSPRPACVYTDIWIDPDRPYTVTFWYNAPGKFEKDQTIFGTWGSDVVTKKPCLPTGCPGFTVSAGETPTSGWKKAEIHVKAPKPGIDMLRLAFQVAPPDEIYLDDLDVSYDN